MVFLCLDVGFYFATGYISLLNFAAIQYLFFSILGNRVFFFSLVEHVCTLDVPKYLTICDAMGFGFQSNGNKQFSNILLFVMYRF